MKENFILFDANTNSNLIIDKNDWEGVSIALTALGKDIEMVVGTTPQMLNEPITTTAIIVGTIGKSKFANELKIDTSCIQGKWESYIIQAVENPIPNVDKAIVIVGSDKRGTIYGIYEISRMIGVSPWVWWGDSVPERRENISFPSDLHIISREPSVKYRGFFMNDEAPSLSGWLTKHFPKVANPQATQGCGSLFYSQVFELLLRLKGNYLWPVMWNNSFHTDDPQNTILADKYGVVMGTSHHEHMTCADKEWNWAKLGEWNYATNRENIYKFWQNGTEARKPYESIITLGMRGQADTSILGEDAALKDNMDLMQKVLFDQREIIKNVHGSADAPPQMLALYKEVEAFYYGDGENKLDVPDDVTLMLCDDNFGHVRTLPTQEMLKRSGGFGMYYHFDYRGGPISYEWINQTPLTKIWDNMTTTYKAGIREIWIVNVGDLKPMEFPLDYFMELAYDYRTWGSSENVRFFAISWATREFGTEYAELTMNFIDDYTKILGARKAEVVLANTFSITEFYEANRVLENFIQVLEKGEKLYQLIPEYKKAAFYQMVMYPARAALYVYQTQIYAAMSLYYAEKGFIEANKYAQMAREAFQKDAEEMEYYNKELSNGKWDGIMRQNHMAYTSWDSPKITVVAEVMPDVGEVPPDSPSAPKKADLLSIFCDGLTSLDIIAQNHKAHEAYLIKHYNGKNNGRQFISGKGIYYRILCQDGNRYGDYNTPVICHKRMEHVYVESYGYVSINPSRFTCRSYIIEFIRSDSNPIEGGYDLPTGEWHVIGGYGREFDSVKLYCYDGKSFEFDEYSPELLYSFFIQNPQEYTVFFFLAPTNNHIHPTVKPISEQQRFYASLHSASGKYEKSIVNGLPEDFEVGDKTWAMGVMNNVRVVSMPSKYLNKGLNYLYINAIDSGVVIQKIVIVANKYNAQQEMISKAPPTQHFMGSYFGPPESFHF